MRELKILCCCGAGMGTCMVLRAKVDKVMSKLGVPADINNESVQIGMTVYKMYDIVFCNQNLAKDFAKAAEAGVTVIGLKNVTSLEEIEEQFLASEIGKEYVK